MNTGDWWKKRTLKQKAFFFVGLAAAIILCVLAGLHLSGSGNAERKNTLALVQMYAEKGEYDRAMNLLDDLLVKNADDKDALSLMDKIIALKEGKKQSSADSAGQPDVNVNIDTSGITKAVQSSLDSMKDELAKSNAATQKNQQAVTDMIEKENRQAQKEQEAAEEKAAQDKAAEEKRRQEDAARKAAEEELVRKNKAVQKEIQTVNDEIAEGKTALATGNIDSALVHFSTAQKNLPISDGEPAFSGSKYSQIASLLYDASQNASDAAQKKKLEDTAVVYAQSAVSKTPADAAPHYILGMNALAEKDRQTALDELTKAVTYDNSNYIYFYNLGKVQYLLRKFSEAGASFLSCVQFKKDFSPAQYNLGLTYLRMGREKEALDSFRKARDIEPRYEKAYLEEARLLARRGDTQGAVSAYNNVIRINNVNGDALRELGTVYFAAENYGASEDSYRKALALLSPDEKDPATYYNLSTTLFAEKKTAEAVAYAKKAYDTKDALRDVNAEANVVYNYALMLDEAGKNDEAIPLYSEVLKLNPNHEKTKINLGVMYLNMNPPDIDMALKLFTQAYNQDKNNFEANNNLGSAYLKKEDYKNAILYFQNALKLDPGNNVVRSNLAQTFAGDGQYDNAKTSYLELIKLDNNNWDAYIELAKVCMSLKDNPSAEKYLLYLQSKQPAYRKIEVDNLLSAVGGKN
ncbi:MAG: tetratricopeptide repeat protein [Treponema sp.]|nr:tetratricopeptide repeat protein [Treponema sp.]